MSHNQITDFEDKDGDRYTVDTVEGVIIVSHYPADGSEVQSVALHAVDGQKIVNGIVTAMRVVAVSGEYQVGPDREQL
jgi:hypothetical protein